MKLCNRTASSNGMSSSLNTICNTFISMKANAKTKPKRPFDILWLLNFMAITRFCIKINSSFPLWRSDSAIHQDFSAQKQNPFVACFFDFFTMHHNHIVVSLSDYQLGALLIYYLSLAVMASILFVSPFPFSLLLHVHFLFGRFVHLLFDRT